MSKPFTSQFNFLIDQVLRLKHLIDSSEMSESERMAAYYVLAERLGDVSNNIKANIAAYGVTALEEHKIF